MKIKEKSISKNFDFVVIGGGMTGLCAAIASARNGAKTALVNDRPVLGGNASSEIRMHICGATANMKKPELSEGGIVHELMLSNKRINDSYNFSIWDAVLFNAVKSEKNLTVFLNTTMFDASCEAGKVEKIECYQMTTERKFTLSADFFADCTGNGSLCAFVGAKFRTGSEGKSEYNEPHAPEKANADRMGNTLLFKAADVGHPVKFIPPVDIIHFTEEQLKYRKHSTEIPKDILEKANKNDMKMLFDGFAQDYGYWWIEIPGDSDNIIDEYED
ncbi:MAG: FAD-dependent oxidoreductase, partial [Clostridia bacterium]|nr:FAD-dependent oxidoreductase [Clostridia bacterium]